VTAAVLDPARIRLARELKEWSQLELARRLVVTAAAVGQFESGATSPSKAVLDRLCVTLEVPLDFLALPLVETHEGFFRSLRRTSVSQRRRARAIAHIAHDLASSSTAASYFPPATIPRIPAANLDADRVELEELARAVRRTWGLPGGPVPNTVELLEDHGVVVIRLPLDTANVDAFSLPFPDHPVIVLGADKDDRARSRFDAAHELGHLVAHGEQVWGVKEVEQQAHAFAAAFLMPAEDIYDDLPTRADWPTLFDLKRTWQVSLAALLMRAKTLGRMSESTYLTAIKAASARGWRRVEPVPLGRPEQPRQLRALLACRSAQLTVDRLPPEVVAALRANAGG
jgi:Zn-dependent peptidase ImmA (M78 family)/DNA-binding XRE family transcriptional regulator